MWFKYQSLSYSAAFPLHHLLEYPDLFMEFIPFGLKCDDLFVIKLVPTEYLIVKAGLLLVVPAGHVLQELGL
jgi:hypothetical protein